MPLHFIWDIKLETQPAEPVSLTWHKNDTEANFKVKQSLP